MRSEPRLPGALSHFVSALAVVALGAAAAAGLAGCDKMRGGDAPAAKTQASGAPASDTASETILVGEFGSLTGSEATFGQSTHNGILLAIDEFNAQGGLNGRKIALKTYDDQGKTQEAGTVVTRLITEDKVVAILGEVASSLSLAGGRVAQQYGVPMISPSSTNPQVTQIGDMIFRVCFIDPFQGWVVARFARDTLKFGKVAVLYDQAQAYSKGLKEDFVKHFQEMGGQVAAEQAYTGGDQDFSAQLTTIKAARPDALFLPGYYTDVGNIALQARKLGLEATLLGGDGWDSEKLTEIGGAAIEGAYFSNHYSHDEQRPEVQAFVKRFQARYNQTPDSLAAQGYDAAGLLFDAMKRAPSLAGKDLAAALAATKDFRAVTGVISIDAERNARKPAVILQVKAGKPTWFATVAPN